MIIKVREIEPVDSEDYIFVTKYSVEVGDEKNKLTESLFPMLAITRGTKVEFLTHFDIAMPDPKDRLPDLVTFFKATIDYKDKQDVKIKTQSDNLLANKPVNLTLKRDTQLAFQITHVVTF